MSVSLHFAKVKYFSEEFTKERGHDDILQELKKILVLEKENTEIDDILNNKFTVPIDTKSPDLIISANIPEIEKSLVGESPILLHPDSRYYFVNENIWETIKEVIFKQSQGIQTKEDFFNIAEDYVKLKECFDIKMLVFEAS
ncbi:hypothetical protein NWP21_05450 [Anabaenopsis sp. FSS-46]|uniref:hypothetical protein n=1 Tax=Anabaenopsis sp. FSS-46 TaxID=2971766 RepID=UPI002473C322|nr:hypothetical protein [Anabaenopsis sp. FSS-46]MDH6098293.1 hypothetical protein [Anabaenopsis sp. FSS-46]